MGEAIRPAEAVERLKGIADGTASKVGPAKAYRLGIAATSLCGCSSGILPDVSLFMAIDTANLGLEEEDGAIEDPEVL
jgi:hypothetical protein